VVSIRPRPPFTPGQRAPGTHCTGGWAGPRAVLDADTRRRILFLSQGSNPGRPVRSQPLYRLSYPADKESESTLQFLLFYQVLSYFVSYSCLWNGQVPNTFVRAAVCRLLFLCYPFRIRILNLYSIFCFYAHYCNSFLLLVDGFLS
jgi:hypothetical protein